MPPVNLLFSALLALSVSGSPPPSETLNPVAWSIKTAPHASVKPGSKFAVTVTGNVQPSWHLYAMEEPDGGPIATKVGLGDGDPASVLRVAASKPQMIHDEALNLTTAVYLTSADFTLYLQAGSIPSHGPLHVLVRYQSCNNKLCLPPRTQILEIPIHIGSNAGQ